MTARQLFEAAPLGAFVQFSDGTPKPPARFKHKLREWEGRNGSARLTSVDPGDPAKQYHPPSFTLTQDHGYIIFNRVHGLDSPLMFDVTLPEPGTILGCSDFMERTEVRHVFRDDHAARVWAHSKNYRLNHCGLKWLLVASDCSLVPFTFPEAESAA